MVLLRTGLRAWIEGTRGKIFAVHFIKRSTFTLRKMRCRIGVKSYLRGGPPAYDPRDYGLAWVFDMEKKDYRSIPLEGVVKVGIRGQWLTVVDDLPVQNVGQIPVIQGAA